MSDVKTVAEILVAGLRLKPARLEDFDFSASMFQDSQARAAFEFINDEWENKRPEKIDLRLIEATNGMKEYLSGLDGWKPTDDADFKLYYRRFRETQIKKSVA